MKALLIFPPGWMQFGPYLSLPILKGYLAERGIQVSLLDLNIEFYDWLLSADTLKSMSERLMAREKRGRGKILPTDYAKLCKALIDSDYVAQNIEAAKVVLRNAETYLDKRQREWAKQVMSAGMNIAESSFDNLQLTLNQICFRDCGLEPNKVLSFLDDELNLIKIFYDAHVRPLIRDIEFDFVGLSLPAWEQLVPALTIVKGLRADSGPDVHVCMGGNYVTRLVGTWGNDPHPYTTLVDSFSVYEGEESLRQLLEALATGMPLSNVSNLVYKDNSQLRRTQIRSLDINTIPAPDFDGLDLSKYFAPEPVLPLFTSRSCPYKCSFCTIPYASSEFRQRNPDRVVNDIAKLKDKYGTRLYTFVDETLMIPSLEGLARGLHESGLDIHWYGETRFHPKINRELTRQLFLSGCRKLQFGLESYNQRVLNLMKKGTRLDCILPNIEDCLSEGIAVHLFTFVGFPGETEEEARNTHDFSQHVMNLSAEKYGNDFSSLGMGAFGLEIYSDVYRRPDLYGVRLETGKKNGASEMFEIKYSVASGLSHEEAEELVAQFENRAAFENVCEQLGRIWWGALASFQTNEDEDFFIYSLTNGLTSDSQEVAPPQARNSHAYILPGQARGSIRLAEGVEILTFPEYFLTAGANTGPSLFFYHREKNLLLGFPEKLGLLVKDYLRRGRLRAEMPAFVRQALNQMLRYGFVLADGEGFGTTLTASEIFSGQPAVLSINPDVGMLALSSGRFVLFNTVTESLVSINAIVAWMVTLLGEKPRELESFINSILAQETRLNRHTVMEALSELVEGIFLILQPRNRKAKSAGKGLGRKPVMKETGGSSIHIV